MKLAIIGSRNVHSVDLIVQAVFHMYNHFTSIPKITAIISGGARGIDRAAEEYAESIGVPVIVKEPGHHPWGPIHALFARNTDICVEADAMIALRLPGKSSGTDDAIAKMQGLNKLCLVYSISSNFAGASGIVPKE